MRVCRCAEAQGQGQARLVMRREPGTSVILNVRLREPVSAAKHADKALRLTFLDEGKPSTHLLKVSARV